MNRGPSDPVEKGASEGAAFKAVARPSRRAPAAVALVAIGFLAVALLGKGLTPAVTPSASATPVSSLAAAPTETPVPQGQPTESTVGPSLGPPVLDLAVAPFPTFVAEPAKPGTTLIDPAGPTPVHVTVTLPAGWSRASDAMYLKVQPGIPAGLSIGAWKLAHVFIFPCRWSNRDFADPPFMRTAAGQAQALSDWWGQDPNLAPFYSNSAIAPIAGKPRPATIGGYPAWYVEVLIPSNFDFSKCDGGQVVLWETADGSVRYGLGPDEHNRLWVVDVDGQILVIDAASSLFPSSEDADELQAVIDSVEISP